MEYLPPKYLTMWTQNYVKMLVRNVFKSIDLGKNHPRNKKLTKWSPPLQVRWCQMLHKLFLQNHLQMIHCSGEKKILRDLKLFPPRPICPPLPRPGAHRSHQNRLCIVITCWALWECISNKELKVKFTRCRRPQSTALTPWSLPETTTFPCNGER